MAVDCRGEHRSSSFFKLSYCALRRNVRTEISKHRLAVLGPAWPYALRFGSHRDGASARKDESERSNPSRSSDQDHEPYQTLIASAVEGERNEGVSRTGSEAFTFVELCQTVGEQIRQRRCGFDPPGNAGLGARASRACGDHAAARDGRRHGEQLLRGDRGQLSTAVYQLTGESVRICLHD